MQKTNKQDPKIQGDVLKCLMSKTQIFNDQLSNWEKEIVLTFENVEPANVLHFSWLNGESIDKTIANEFSVDL